jgi:glycosyltransferase involved in cell wall biosynthesis
VKLHIFSEHTFEPWDWTNSTDPKKGIGGSETFATEMAWRLAQRGHEVTAYSPTAREREEHWRGVLWRDSSNLKEEWFGEPGIWLLQRCPEFADNFEVNPNQELWCVLQDTIGIGFEDPVLGPQRAEKIRYVVCLCQDHAQFVMARYPYLAGKVLVSTNGVKVDDFRKIDALALSRNPKKLVYSSSPDRGLLHLLQIFRVARETVPDLELHVFYGWNNIDAWGGKTPHVPNLRQDVEKLITQPGVINHGRVGQPELWKHYATAGIWCYPTTFTETSCITSMEAQALGAIPITNPLWALRENVQFGVLIPGDCWRDELVKARYVEELIQLAANPPEAVRAPMMDYARHRFSWERVTDQFHGWFLDLPYGAIAQYSFQHTYATGKILNVGCNNDSSGFAEHRGAINVDITKFDPYTNAPNAAHLIMDARDLQFKDGSFDTVVLGEILEHLDTPDVVKALQEAKRVLTPGGQIVVTVPEDHRESPVKQEYSDGIRAYHDHAITPAEVEGWAKDAGLEVVLTQPLDYTFCTGWGFVLKESL